MKIFKYHDGNSEPQGFGHICEFYFPYFLPIFSSLGNNACQF